MVQSDRRQQSGKEPQTSCRYGYFVALSRIVADPYFLETA